MAARQESSKTPVFCVCIHSAMRCLSARLPYRPHIGLQLRTVATLASLAHDPFENHSRQANPAESKEQTECHQSAASRLAFRSIDNHLWFVQLHLPRRQGIRPGFSMPYVHTGKCSVLDRQPRTKLPPGDEPF